LSEVVNNNNNNNNNTIYKATYRGVSHYKGTNDASSL